MGLLPYVSGGQAPAARRSGRTAPGTGRLHVMAVLSAIFNCLALNLAVVLACLPIVTLPAVFAAAVVALDRWRDEGEDRVVREFVAALRSRPLLHTTLAGGGPLVMAAVALEEVHFFAGGGPVINWLCLGLGLDALVISIACFGYAVVLAARRPDMAASDLWYLAITLAVRNLLRASPLLIAEIVGVVLLLLVDPALALIGLPLGLIAALRRTADPALRRAEARANGPAR
jgi:hypothetical protein